MASDWNIKSRSPQCTATGKAFSDEEEFYTLLYTEKDGFRREDLCEEAWLQHQADEGLFSFWKSTFQLPPPADTPQEPMQKQTAETLLRQLIDEDDATNANARYILALMLERKKILKPLEAKESETGRLLIYEHAKTGEIFLIPDPMLQLDQVEAVQEEVGALLGIPPRPAAAESANPPTPAEASASGDASLVSE